MGHDIGGKCIPQNGYNVFVCRRCGNKVSHKIHYSPYYYSGIAYLRAAEELEKRKS